MPAPAFPGRRRLRLPSRRWLAAAVGGASLLLVPGLASPASSRSTRLRVLPEVPVTGNDERLQLGHNSPVLLADPREPRFVVLASRLDNPDFGCALQLSGDGGRSWVPVRPVPDLPSGADKCYAPEIAFDRGGVLYYLFIALQGQGNNPSGTYLVTSSDRGRTFSPPRQVLGPQRYMVRMAIDPTVGRAGRMYLVWL
ncbi:MAG: exo-alpha-sialidase, partial [Actinobacteria bacterium]|nr:exo-alpha-sialidase [Actinomycetota bacterium]